MQMSHTLHLNRCFIFVDQDILISELLILFKGTVVNDVFFFTVYYYFLLYNRRMFNTISSNNGGPRLNCDELVLTPLSNAGLYYFTIYYCMYKTVYPHFKICI